MTRMRVERVSADPSLSLMALSREQAHSVTTAVQNFQAMQESGVISQ